MKKLIFAIIVLLLACVLFSCGEKSTYSASNAQIRDSDTSMAMTYEKLNGYREVQFTVNEGQFVTVYISFVTKSGELDVYIAKDNDKSNAVYIRKDVASTSFCRGYCRVGCVYYTC